MTTDVRFREAAAIVPPLTPELVVLVDEHNQVLGTMPKVDVHGERTPLHRGFSAFVFRTSDRRLLLQRRSRYKRTWPLVWANSCCGHPTINESTVDAARRRLKFELSLEPAVLNEVAPYRYCASHDGIMENEICPIVVGLVENEPVLNRDEVESVCWVDWKTFVADIRRDPSRFAEWCVEEAMILEANESLDRLLARLK